MPATKNHQGGLGDSEDESDTKIFSVLEPQTGQQSAPHIQLELMPRQPHQAMGKLIEFLSKIILSVMTSVTIGNPGSLCVTRDITGKL